MESGIPLCHAGTVAFALPHGTRSFLQFLPDVVDQLTEEDAGGDGIGILEIQRPLASLSFSGKEADFLDVLPAEGLGRGPGNERAQMGYFSPVAAPPGGPGMAGAEPGTPPGAPRPVIKHDHVWAT